jgi:hypothetical protein
MGGGGQRVRGEASNLSAAIGPAVSMMKSPGLRPLKFGRRRATGGPHHVAASSGLRVACRRGAGGEGGCGEREGATAVGRPESCAAAPDLPSRPSLPPSFLAQSIYLALTSSSFSSPLAGLRQLRGDRTRMPAPSRMNFSECRESRFVVEKLRLGGIRTN